jgi:mycothiol synthase
VSIGPPLPAGYALRAPERAEAPDVVALINAVELADQGEIEMTLEDLVVEWNRPGFDLATDAWLVTAPDGSPAAYMDVYFGRGRAAINPSSGVDPNHTGLGIGALLLATAVSRGTEMLSSATEATREEITHIVSVDNPFADVLGRSGFEESKRHWVMRIDMAEPPEPPSWPEGVAVRAFVPGRDDEVIYRLVQTAFDDIEERTWSPYDEWRVYLIDREDFDPSLWFLAVEGDDIVGCALAVEYPEEGWVRQFAVRRDARGRGIGTALLREAFCELNRRGERRVGLGVSATNESAQRLYRGAGMRVHREYVEYAKKV